MAGPGSNQVGQGNSNKNTLLNKYSKLTPYGATMGSAPAPASPYDYGSYASTVMGLQTQLASAQALAKAGIGQARADWTMARNDARTQRIQGVTDAEANAQQRGILGSSIDLAGRGSAVAAAMQARQAAAGQFTNTVAGIRGQQIGAVGQFYSGLGAAQAQLANQQAMANIQRYQNDQFDVYQADFNKLRQSILARLNSRGRVRDLPYTQSTVGMNTSGAGYASQTGQQGFNQGKPLY